jgi:F-type H+-transporting ATPase subunit alpha
LEGDLTGYVQSNLVSMTDGQIAFSTPLFGEGQKPAVDLGLSVSRVGSKVQWKAIKKLAGPLRLEYLQYREVMRVSKLKTSGQSEEMQQQLKGGEILTELLKQDKDSPVRMEQQVLILYSYNKKILHELTLEEVNKFQIEIYEFVNKRMPDLMTKLREKKDYDDEMATHFDKIITEYVEGVKKNRPKEEDDIESDSNVGVDMLDKATTKKKEGK